MEGYFEQVVDALTGAGYRWYETANFCLEGARAAGGRDLRARHNLAYWWGRDYLGIGIGAVSTVAGVRRRNLPGSPRTCAALGDGDEPPRERRSSSTTRRGRASGCCSGSVSTSRCALDAVDRRARPRGRGAAGAPRPRRADGGQRPEHVDAHAARPVPRRRRHAELLA